MTSGPVLERRLKSSPIPRGPQELYTDAAGNYTNPAKVSTGPSLTSRADIPSRVHPSRLQPIAMA